MRQINYNTIEITDIFIWDYPDFCDAYISYAEYDDGEPLNEEQLDVLNEDRDLVYEYTLKQLF